MGIGTSRAAFDRCFGRIYSFLYKMFRCGSAEKMMLKGGRAPCRNPHRVHRWMSHDERTYVRKGEGMSLSGAHRSAFRREAAQEGRVFSIKDDSGFPAPADGEGRRSVPFWSKPTRAQRIVQHVEAFHGFEVVQIEVDDWLSL